jgi:membrane peptidoglycan carboxypeptidase
MGQGIGVTPLQLVQGVSVIASGGFRVRPHTVKRHSGDVEKVSFETEREPVRILSSETAAQVTEMLTGVVKKGTAKNSQLEGFTAAGKTGTAQKIDPDGRYSHSRFIASFAGFAPAERPAVAIVVTIDEPRGQYYGGEVAAPVFRNIAEKTLRYLAVSPDQELTLAQLARHQAGPASSLRDLATDQFEPVEANWEGEINESRAAEPQETDFLDSVREPQATSMNELDSVEVPDFRGKSLRAVMTESSRLGLQLGIFGSGLVTEQSPAPASRVEAGSKVMIRLSRRLY